MHDCAALIVNDDPLAQIKSTVVHIAGHAVASGSKGGALHCITRHVTAIRVEKDVRAVDQVHEVSWHKSLLAVGGSAKSLSHREAG